MAIQRLEPESPQSFESVPFLKEWLENKPFPDGEIFRIRRFKLGDKGISIFTDSFCCFLFKNEKLSNQVLEAIGHYLQQADAYGLVCILEKSQKRKFTVAMDDELITEFDEIEPNHWSQKYRDEFPKPTSALSLKEEDNPLIKKTQSRSRNK